jgi:purine-cytosine permease-like protein
MAIESRSIDFVPENERHGRVQDQGPFWFLSNFHFFAIAIGFVGPSLGLSLGATAVAGILGIIIGTALQAFHASQGPEMGLPQMIQSRAQFGFRRFWYRTVLRHCGASIARQWPSVCPCSPRPWPFGVMTGCIAPSR